MVRGGGLSLCNIIYNIDGKPYSVPLSRCSSEGKLFFLVCVALQLCPAG